MEDIEVKENIMGTMPVGRLLMKLSVPMMVSMLIQAMYNVVDSIFVSRVSEAALTSVSLAFSLQNLMISVAVGTGVGVNAMLSKSLGERNQHNADRAADNGIFLAVCSWLVFVLIGIFLLPLYFGTQTTDPEIYQGGVEYMFVCCVFGGGLFLSCMLEKILGATGRTNYAMMCQAVGAITNIILDPIFIFGYCGEALSGVRGAAIATVIGQIFGSLLGFYLILRKTPEIHVSLKHFRPNLPAIQRIYAVGAPTVAMQSVGSVMVYGFNQILMGFSTTAVAVFGIYFKLQSFSFMPVYGLNNGMVPIIGYNYGARKPHRVIRTAGYAMAVAIFILTMGMVSFHVMPGTLLRMFDASEQMLAIGTVALRIISLSFPLAAVAIILCAVYQALGHGLYSLYMSLGRQLLVLVPMGWLLSKAGRLELVWWAFPIAEVAGILIGAVCMHKVWKEILHPMLEADKLHPQK